MATYRPTRNVEASVIDYLQSIFAMSGGWSNVVIEKTFAKIYGTQVDSNKQQAAICVRVLSSKLPKSEIGSNAIQRYPLVMIDIFATSDGQREDMKDYIIQYMKYGCPYYQYQVSGNLITSKVQTGYLRAVTIDDTPVNFNTDKSSLAVLDRYRHALSISMTTGQVEE
jgi:hypothetical protein